MARDGVADEAEAAWARPTAAVTAMMDAVTVVDGDGGRLVAFGG